MKNSGHMVRMMRRHQRESHPGFEHVSEGIAAREGISQERADAILASSSRKASAKAKRENPRLKKVRGK